MENQIKDLVYFQNNPDEADCFPISINEWIKYELEEDGTYETDISFAPRIED